MSFFKPGGNYPVDYELSFLQSWTPVFITGILMILVFKYRNIIKNNKNVRKVIEIFLLGLLILVQTGSWLVDVLYSDGNYFVFSKHDLPLHLCSLSLIVFLYIYFTKNNKLHKTFFYFAVLGAILGMAFSTTSVGPMSFEYWRFFIAHLFIALGYFYYLFAYESYVTSTDIIRSIKVLIGISVVMMLFNLTFGTYYFFIGPSAYEKIRLFQLFPHWTIATIAVVSIIIGYLYLCFKITYKIEKKTLI